MFVFHMMNLGPRTMQLDNVEAEFFGRRTAFPTIARRSRASRARRFVVAAVKREHDNSFRGVALPPIFVQRTRSRHRSERATQSVVHLLEGLVRPDPDQCTSSGRCARAGAAG